MSKKLFLSKRSYVFFFALLVVSIGVAFKGPIFHFALKKYVSYKIPLEGNWNFNYSYLSLEKKGVAIHDIVLNSQKQEILCKIGKVLCKAPAIEKASMSNQFIIDNLELIFNKKISSNDSLSANQIRSILHSLRQVEIKNGVVKIPQREMKLSLAKSFSSQKLGEVIFSQEGQGQIKVELSSWADRWIMDIEAKQSAIAFYKDFMDFFIGKKTSDWKIEKGRLDGSCFFSISSKNVIKDARMHMNLLDGKIRNDASGILSSFDRVFFDLSYPVASQSDAFIKNIKITSSVDKGLISVYDEKGENRFCFKDLSGYFTIDSFKEAGMEISGFIDDRGRLLPVKLLGKPAKKNKQGLELDLSLELDPIFGHSANVNVICSYEKGAFLIKSSLDSLEVRQMLILQECLSLIYPEVRDYSINKGQFSGDVLLKINPFGIEDLHLKNIRCNDIEIYSKEKDIHIDAKKATGELQIELFDKKKTVIPSWKLDLTDGNFIIGRENELPYHLENTNIKIATKDNKFINSYIDGVIGGIKGKVNIEGTEKKPIFDIYLSARADDVLAWLPNKNKHYEEVLTLVSRVEKKQGTYFGSSFLSIKKDQLGSDINFTWNGSNKDNLAIEFYSKDFSGEFFPFFNEITNFSWSTSGNFSFTGEYKDKNLSAEIEGNNCTYRQEHSLIKEARGTAAFHSIIGEGKWSMDIHLLEGNKRLLEGKKLFLTNANIHICSEDTFFKLRNFEGSFANDKFLSDYIIHINKCDLKRDGKKEFDISVHNPSFELCRLSGVYENDKAKLNEYSHLFDKDLIVNNCSFSKGTKAEVSCEINLDSCIFPRLVREQRLGNFLCKLSLDNQKYNVSCLSNDLNIILDGIGKDFKIKIQDCEFLGKVKPVEKAISIGAGKVKFKNIDLKVDSFDIDKDGINIKAKTKWENLTFAGEVETKFSDLKSFKGKGKATYCYDDENIKIKSIDDFSFIYNKKLIVNNGLFSVIDTNAKAFDFYAKSIVFHDKGNKISLHGIEGTVNKKVLKDRLKVDIVDDRLDFFGEADILCQEKDFWLSGHIKEKKYVLNGKEVYVQGVNFRGNKKAFIFDCDVPFYGSNINLCTHLYFDEKVLFQIDGFENGKKVLVVDGSFKDKLEVFRCKGDLIGIGFDLTPSNEPGKEGFAAQLDLDLQKMKPILPLGLVEFIDRMSLCKGLSLVGDINLIDGPSFSGIIKGTDFDFIKYSFSSLFGKIDYKDGVCKVKDFAIADRSFTAKCNEATFDTRSKGCLFDTKEFHINNLRPCLLSKKGERKKLTHPFMLDRIDFLDVRGDLSDVNTIKGKGYIHFINSFDRQTNAVFDFAKDIIGRIGLDPILMVPIVGELDFNLSEGKMNFIKMQNSFSDKQRSYFYLWHKTPSYLDYDGNIHIDIYMKQHVLFKFAELFIISLDGSISSPKIFLK